MSPQIRGQPQSNQGLDLKIGLISIRLCHQLWLSWLRHVSSDWPCTLAKHISQKLLGTKIVHHLLLPGPKVLTNEDGDERGNIFGRHIEW